MAYVSNTLNNLYKPNRDNQSNTGAVDKNVGQDTSGLGAGGPAKAPGQFTQAQSLQGATNATLQRNKGAGEGVANALIQPGQRQAAATTQGLQQEGNEYKTQSSNVLKQPEYNKADLGSLGSDPNAAQRIGSALNPIKPVLENYTTKQNVAIQNPTALNPGNYGATLQKEKGQSYTSGMGALDDALFSRSPNRQAGLQQQYAGLQGGVDTQLNANKALTGQLQGDYDTKLKSLQDTIRGDLGTQKQSTLSAAEQQNAAFKASEQARVDAEKAKYGNRDTAIDFLNVGNPAGFKSQAIGEAIRKGGVNVNDYIKGADVSGANAMTAEQASQLNGIESLLGGGGSYSASSYAPQNSTFDKAGYDAKILQMIQEAAAPASKGGVIMDNYNPTTYGKSPAPKAMKKPSQILKGK